MEEYRRLQVGSLVERLSEPPRLLIAVFGPRQTGKTTAIRQALATIQRPHLLEAIDMPGVSGEGLSPESSGRDVARSMAPGAVRDRRWPTSISASSPGSTDTLHLQPDPRGAARVT